MRPLPYARLLRIPNVFTAVGDVLLGACAAIAFRSEPVDATFLGRAALLVIASACLYCAGMVWNDLFDLEEDRRDRPFRPLPSGAVSVRAARLLAIVLTVAGWLVADAAGDFAWPGSVGGSVGVSQRGLADEGTVATLLVAAIILYDRWLKRTPAGPVGMGLCRFLNVLLGLTLSPSMPDAARCHLAATVGLYIVGVTWFARTEATVSNARQLQAAAFVMLGALLLALAVPVQAPEDAASPLFPYLLVAFGFYVGFPVTAAVENPSPARVQAAVKRSILGLIALDAILASAFVGTPGLLVVLLLPPALLVGKWVYST